MKKGAHRSDLILALCVFFTAHFVCRGEFIPDRRLEDELLELSRQSDGPYIPPEPVRQELLAYVHRKDA